MICEKCGFIMGSNVFCEECYDDPDDDTTHFCTCVCDECGGNKRGPEGTSGMMGPRGIPGVDAYTMAIHAGLDPNITREEFAYYLSKLPSLIRHSHRKCNFLDRLFGRDKH